MSGERRFFTVTELYQHLEGGVSKLSLYNNINSGKLPHIRIGKKILIPAEAIAGLTKGPSANGLSLPPPDDTIAFWDLTQAAAWSGLGVMALRRLVKEGRVPHHRNGKGVSAKIIFPRRGFQEWFNAGGMSGGVKG